TNTTTTTSTNPRCGGWLKGRCAEEERAVRGSSPGLTVEARKADKGGGSAGGTPRLSRSLASTDLTKQPRKAQT
ncbi:unnamed protein product, partial [Laminaria digitata]